MSAVGEAQVFSHAAKVLVMQARKALAESPIAAAARVAEGKPFAVTEGALFNARADAQAAEVLLNKGGKRVLARGLGTAVTSLDELLARPRSGAAGRAFTEQELRPAVVALKRVEESLAPRLSRTLDAEVRGAAPPSHFEAHMADAAQLHPVPPQASIPASLRPGARGYLRMLNGSR